MSVPEKPKHHDLIPPTNSNSSVQPDNQITADAQRALSSSVPELPFEDMMRLASAIARQRPANPRVTAEIHITNILHAANRLTEFAKSRGLQNPYRRILDNAPGLTLERLGEMLLVLESLPSLPEEDLPTFVKPPVNENREIGPYDRLFSNALIAAAQITDEQQLRKKIREWNSVVLLALYPEKERPGYVLKMEDVEVVRSKLAETPVTFGSSNVEISVFHPERAVQKEQEESVKTQRINRIKRAAQIVRITWKHGSEKEAERYNKICLTLEDMGTPLSEIIAAITEGIEISIPDEVLQHYTLQSTQK